MNWTCRLYGHQWRHPGPFEVILTDDGVSAFPFECVQCADAMVVRREVGGGPEGTGVTPERAPKGRIKDGEVGR